MTAPFGKHDLFVSPAAGNDRWSGRLAEPDAAAADGPLATIGRARDLLRERKFNGALPAPVTVWLRGGRHALAEPLAFGPDDSGPITYAAYPGEEPVLDGGQILTGWRVETREADGRVLWTLDLPEVAAGRRYFRSLFVGGERRPRAHYPKVSRPDPDWLWIEDVPGSSFRAELFEGTNAFVARPGDFRPWHRLDDVEVVVLHYWIEERMPVAAFDPDTRRVTSTRRSIFALKDDFTSRWAKYYVDNVFEHLTEPGEWYLDRASSRLHYLPLPGETPEATIVVAPRSAGPLLTVRGLPDENRYVEFLRFDGLTFEHTDWAQPSGGLDPGHRRQAGELEFAAAAQSAYNVPGVIRCEGARFCVFESCRIRHVGGYGIEMGDGCVGNRIVGCEITDTGAGGIHLNGADAAGARSRRTGGNRISDNEIHHCGRVFHSGCGILARHTFGNTIAHNHIHHLYYSAISCGWVWGYGESVARDNRIEANHIHDLGQGWLSDMGGIYTLGVQPGTVLRGNHIHDIRAHNYGGWAIYPDEGSSHLVIENNVCYNAASNPFNQHYGRENVVRNNIWAFGGNTQVNLGRHDGHVAFTLERNLLVTRDQPLFEGGYGADFRPGTILSDYNLFWSVTGAPPTFRRTRNETVDLAGWRALGYDRHSVVADPGFRDAANYDFTLAPDSPALALGFTPIDLNGVGPRPPEARD